MSKGETILNKVILTVSRIPRMATMKVYKATGVEKRNTYQISSMDLNENGVMEKLRQRRIITKRNILNVDPCFMPSEISVTTWCLDDQIPSAIELCKEAMELYLEKHVERAKGMRDLFQDQKAKMKCKEDIKINTRMK